MLNLRGSNSEDMPQTNHFCIIKKHIWNLQCYPGICVWTGMWNIIRETDAYQWKTAVTRHTLVGDNCICFTRTNTDGFPHLDKQKLSSEDVCRCHRFLQQTNISELVYLWEMKRKNITNVVFSQVHSYIM